MEPLTKIELKGCKWLGILAFAASAAAELLSLAQSPDGKRGSFVQRENIRRVAGRSRKRSR